MSELQKEAVRMISGLSDDNIRFLIEIIHRLMPQDEKINSVVAPPVKEDRGMQAFRRLDVVREEIKRYLPDGFDPEKELEEARTEKMVV